jgi:hypothetical protein
VVLDISNILDLRLDERKDGASLQGRHVTEHARWKKQKKNILDERKDGGSLQGRHVTERVSLRTKEFFLSS